MVAACAAVLALATGCVTVRSRIGNWAYEDQGTYVEFALERADKCVIGTIAKGRAGVGAHCSCVIRDNVITVNEYWDNSRIRWPALATIELKYDPIADTMTLDSDGRNLVMSRVSKLIDG